MLADRVRMASSGGSFDGVLYKDGVGGNLWTNTVNPNFSSHNEILQTTPFLEINAPFGTFGSMSPIATKEKYDLSKFNTIKVKYEVLSDGRTLGVKEVVIDISSLSEDLYIVIEVVFTTGRTRMTTTLSDIQNEVTFDFPYHRSEMDWDYNWGLEVNNRVRIYSYILE